MKTNCVPTTADHRFSKFIYLSEKKLISLPKNLQRKKIEVDHGRSVLQGEVELQTYGLNIQKIENA